MAAITFTTSKGCQQGAGFFALTSVSSTISGGDWFFHVRLGSVEYGTAFDPLTDLPLVVGNLADEEYELWVSVLAGNNASQSAHRQDVIDCPAGGPGSLLLDSVSHTDETAAGNDGTATIQASGGTPPLTAALLELSQSLPATSGQPTTFPGLPGGNGYTLRVTDSSNPAQQVEATVTVAAYTPPVTGCQDEYADNYDPAATTGGVDSCTYTPRWRSAWGPQGVAVRVAAVAGQAVAYIAADLRVGFRPGHPLAAVRPLGEALRLRATVGPDGYATFVLGPYLRPQLGAADGAGGYRLDLNSPTAFDADLYVGYELRRAGTGELLEHGYALNAAVPDAMLQRELWPFAELPVWPGFEDYLVSYLDSSSGTGQYGVVARGYASNNSGLRHLPCPPNPLPVAWLGAGGYGFWVFQGRPMRGDEVGEGQQYREPGTGQRRYADPGEAYQTFRASSGVFRGDTLLEGLRTLWRSTQAWAQLVPGAEWVPILVERGSREVGRMGVLRNEVSVSFQVAAPEWAQGQ